MTRRASWDEFGESESASVGQGEHIATPVRTVTDSLQVPALLQPGHDVGDRRPIQPQVFAERALVDTRVHREKIEYTELHGRDVGTNLLQPECGMNLLRTSDEVAGVLREFQVGLARQSGIR